MLCFIKFTVLAGLVAASPLPISSSLADRESSSYTFPHRSVSIAIYRFHSFATVAYMEFARTDKKIISARAGIPLAREIPRPNGLVK